jgi:hypothetical protein
VQCSHIQERVFPGAFREGGLNNEDEDEEDERTIQTTTEPPIPPTLSAELVDAGEEERCRQDEINQAFQKALQRERQLVQNQINQALQRERHQAVVAEVIPEVVPEVIPEVVSKRDKRWKFVGAFLLLVLIVMGVVLGIMLHPNPETLIPQNSTTPEPTTLEPTTPESTTQAPTSELQSLSEFLSSVSSDGGEALRNPSTPQYEALAWLAGNANLASYTGQEKIQRYALATLYYNTKGESLDSQHPHFLSSRDFVPFSAL